MNERPHDTHTGVSEDTVRYATRMLWFGIIVSLNYTSLGIFGTGRVYLAVSTVLFALLMLVTQATYREEE